VKIMSRVDVNISKENYDTVIQLIERNNGKMEFNSELKNYYHIIVEIEEKIAWDIIRKYNINSHL
jgi:uncharacterized protein YjaG (DUF416 family)